MLNVYHSNNMELLKTLVIQLIKNDPLKGVFEQEQILVQSSGISQWLKLGIAEEIGITANTKFPLPASFLWEMFNVVLPELPKESAFSKEMMKWKIMKILPSVIDTPEFEAIKSYLANDTKGTKNHQLADKIADLYDQYSVYRPEWIAEWEKGEWNKEVIGNHVWQPILWKLLVELTNELGQSPYHRANMYEDFISKVKLGNFEKDKLPKRLFVVGISSLPPRFLDALEALSKHIEIHLMFANPCRFYWGDIKDRKYLAKFEAKRRKKMIIENSQAIEQGETSLLKSGLDYEMLVNDDETIELAVGNSLLASMGKTGRDYLSLLAEKESYEIDAFVEIERDSLLHNIQADILNLNDKSQNIDFETNNDKGIIQLGDKSISISGSFSPQREVEALHDYLLGRFNDETELSPQDIVVMVSDIDKYSHHISSVFGGTPRDRYIPYSISDRTASSEAPVLQVFLDLLGIGIGRQEASKVMEILEVPSVMRKFDIDEDGLHTLSMWIEQSGIRWGLDGKTAVANGLPEPKQNHWLFGLSRMVMGYAIPQDEGEFGDILPYNECQGSTAELAGKLGQFIDSMITLRDMLDSDHNIEDWIQVINSVIDTFFDITKEEEDAVATIRSKVAEFYKVVTDAEYDQLISTDIVFRHFNGIFSKDRLSQHYMMGKVTFCTLMPMRSIPFKEVCLLGMNDGMYPRASQPAGFDLMAAHPQVGDRSRRNDDRYLFLEAILSAQDRLYVSYIDRKIQDNTERVPSVLVSELIEYIQKSYCLDCDNDKNPDIAEKLIIENMLTQHSLSPFSPEAFSGINQSFATEWVPASISSSSKRSRPQDIFLSKPLENILLAESSNKTDTTLDVSELLRFWSLPVKHFFTRRLKVNFDIKAGLSNDEEMFDLNAKDAFPVKRQWLDLLLERSEDGFISIETKELAFKEIIRKFELEGALPHGGFGESSLKGIRNEVEFLAEMVAKYTQKEPLELFIDVDVDIQGGSCKLSGWARRVYEQGSVYYRAGSLRSQDILQAWIQHLGLCASGVGKPTFILCMNQQVMIGEIHEKIAQKYLCSLVSGYHEGMCEPLPFLPRCSKAALDAGYSKLKSEYLDFESCTEKVEIAVETAFNGGFGSSGGESQNAYISRIWSDLDGELVEKIYESGLKYLAPALKLLSDIE
ncbi:exodeoxyribonuclease V subunit gamma [Vibrio coralliirubri]|uniref:exodeoxyribonuclease V subunit gamma n=1 Tax=Vibrio coralliirubri TaxID=1516159 RepID=UPI002284BD6C|nr:exodeoxyribonuclease V subunit gamma [Vibrio coralliirubri]MCY9861276.1 exodeoxyribonuclease V subunit gamma [Vibrio coralliirubri]